MVRNWKHYGQRADIGELYITKNQFMTGNLVGILMAPDKIQNMNGHLGNASTFRFPVRYKVVESLYSSDESIIKTDIQDCIKELELEGCRCILTSGGQFALYDNLIRNTTDLPSISSPLIELEFASLSLAPTKNILVYSSYSECENKDFLKALNMPEAIVDKCIFTQNVHNVSDEYCCTHQIGAVFWDSPEGILQGEIDNTPLYTMVKLVTLMKNVVTQQPYEGNI